MTPVFSAFKKLLANPTENYKKVWPYLCSRSEPFIRKTYEKFDIEAKSKPYPGHDDLLSELDYRDGFFIECGGNDGYGFDPIYYLEKFRGWRGFIIEPIPRAAKLCRSNRPNSKVFEFALVSNNYTGTHINLYDCNTMSVTETTRFDINEWMKAGEDVQKITSEKISVPTITLNKLIENNGLIKEIDLLMIDVEGSEEEVLKGFDLIKYKPKYILIEIHTKDQQKALEDIFGKNYSLIKQIAYNDYLYKLIS